MESIESPVVVHESIAIVQKIANGQLLLLDKPGKSRVWTIFSRLIDRSGTELYDYAYCKCCKKAFKYNKSTSNLRKHAFKCMRKDVANENRKLLFIENAEHNLMKLLTNWLIKERRSYDLINNQNLIAVFQEIAMLGSKYGADIDIGRLLPSFSAIAQNISTIYEECLQRVKQDINAIKDNGFGLSIDEWTDNFTNQKYIALSIHYLKNAVLTFGLLGLRPIDEINMHQNITETVEEILSDFDCKLSTKSIIVTNGGVDMSKAFANTQNLSCITELINNAIQNSLEFVPTVAEIINKSFKLAQILKKMDLLDGFSATLHLNRFETVCKLLNSLETHWNEILNSLQNTQEIELVLAININHLMAVAKTLKPFEEAIEALEDDNYATLHLVIVCLHELKKTCDTNDNEFKDFEFIEIFKENIRVNLEEMVSKNITILHKLALFLYPPTNKLLQFSIEEKQSTEEECIRLMTSFNNDVPVCVKQEKESPTTTPLSKRRKLFLDFVDSEVDNNPFERIKQEIQYYKNTRVPNSADFDVFSWWELQKYNFPILYKLSCMVLSTPASCAASKRIFSSASSLLCEKSNLEVEQIMFINSNSEYIDSDTE